LSDYRELQGLIESDPDEVARQSILLLDKNPDDALALFLLASVYARSERFGLALTLFQRVAGIRPDRAEAWNNVGMALQGLHRSEEARAAFLKAKKLDPKAPGYPANVALTFMEQRDYRKALEWCAKAFEIEPNHKGAMTTYGMSNLALGNWSEGWPAMSSAIGGKFRKEVVFGDEGRWDGSEGKTVVIYGEQGLGDEIMYASCVPDAQKRCKKVIVECDPRLQGLFQRSFPAVPVYGTRRQSEITWPTLHEIDARCAIGQLPEFFRLNGEFPGTPYLTADPERRVQWRALFDSWGKKPKIGLCWSGGSKHNNPESRAVGLETFRPLIEGFDADYVSLQYQDPGEEIAKSGLPVKRYPRATLTDDYDDTAGLVAELDLVVGPHTSVHHLAGALGVKSLILVPEKTIWLYAGESLPWYGTATLLKQKGTWADTMPKVLEAVRAYF
jgi:cytochrome c-type biogenesis protein CcmH/NrfG